MSAIAKSPPAALFQLVTDQWTRPFWEAAAERRLTAPKCADCGRFRLPPTPFCPHCLSQRLEWPQLSGNGTIYSYVIVERAIMPEMADSVPYVPALVSLPDADDIRLVTNIVGVPIDCVRIGAPVRVVWEEHSEGLVLPRFTFA